MTDDAEHVWRLPGSVRGKDVRLDIKGSGGFLSPSARARLRRIINKAPEAMVKLTGRCRGGPVQLKSHLDYITRNGRLQAETQDGQRITGREALRNLHDDWLLANAAHARSMNRPNATQSVALILSMPPGTSPDRVEAAARTWARETFAGKNDWLMVRHDDTDHPHVHVTVRAVGQDGRRLAPGPNDLQQWRERFARELRRLGVEAEATPRQARGRVRKSPTMAAHQADSRGPETQVQKLEKQAVEREARSRVLPEPRQWSHDIQARQDSIRRAYLGHADALQKGDAPDQQLARDIRRFVADMPVPLTRRQAMVVELRHVLHQQNTCMPAAKSPPLSPSQEKIVRPEMPKPAIDLPTPPDLSTGRR